MKKSVNLLAGILLVILFVASSAVAGDEKSQTKVFTAAMFPATDASKLWLCLEKYQPWERVTLTLLNEQGTVLFEEIVSGKKSKQKAYRQQFDISQLADGAYTFRISAGSQVEQYTFLLLPPPIVYKEPTRRVVLR